MDVIRDRDTEVRIQGHNINNLEFADDIDMIEENRNKLQENMNEIRKAGEAAGLKTNVGKTNTMVTGKENIKEQIELEDIKKEKVKKKKKKKKKKSAKRFTSLVKIVTRRAARRKEEE